jgi:hypothetical protein
MKSTRTSSLTLAVVLTLFLSSPFLAAAETTVRPFSFNLTASRQESAPEPPKKSRVHLIGLFDIGAATLKSSAASRLETGSSGFMFGMGGGVMFFDIVDLGVGFGLLFLSDKNPFTNLTTGGEKKSAVSPLFYYAQAGLQLPIPVRSKDGLYHFWIACHAGVMGVSVDRSIPSCVDCDVEELSMTGRTFFKPEFKFQLERGAFIGISYTVFCQCSDFKSMFALSLNGYWGDN